MVNLISDEQWTAIRGKGALRNGKPLPAFAHRTRIDLLGLESSARSLKAAQPLVERSSKIRILGSMALSIAHTAAGGLDVFCAPVPMRVFDMAASLLIIAEAGGVATNLQGKSLDALECTLTTRTTLLCAPDGRSHAAAIKAFSEPA